jgi:hypothetical protein
MKLEAGPVIKKLFEYAVWAMDLVEYSIYNRKIEK